jgi:hypothetical protein
MRTNRRTSGVSDQNGAPRDGHAGALLAPCVPTVTQVISPLDSSPLAEVPLFSSYRLNGSYDEMFGRDGRPRAPILDNVQTYLLSEPDYCRYVLEHLDSSQEALAPADSAAQQQQQQQ